MKNITLRYFYFILGLAINAFGIAFITKSALGTSPISSVPYVLSLRFTAISFGMFTFIMNMIFILLQIVLLRKNFEPIQFLQIVVNVAFSWFIDIAMTALSFLNPQQSILQLVFLLIGCAILAMGICIEVAANTVLIPGEGIVKAIFTVLKAKFGTIKIFFDVSLIVISVILSFVFFGKLNGLGLGTIISAVAVGKIVNIINHSVPFIEKIKNLSAA
ncbi:YitT family protein [Treponema phagedenis]|uniref:YitT family protein n=1 Tax=Treponema phagedenis TaxID=162 RepID=A0A0B7GZ67_TREPH|nr:DUF6198 family protein [Treponema phagedenis]NVP24079.1 YitT family protein [Treponema phagedenis]QEJ96223.1 YitT family protein [Treponema phagedenis]QEJ99353.1 YitT family protein [Treponema phagedenis]QEK00001.1 YitT family protein [Treponema phagedenis]QEK04923.1 YitT family protein [Treponema phagedenis]